jgi:CRP-like cAMP-binding protein
VASALFRTAAASSGVDGAVVAHVGSGAILGERAVLEGDRRTATLRAVRSSRVAVIGAGMIDRTALSDVAIAHRREAS